MKHSRRKGIRLIRDRLTYGRRVPFKATASEVGHGRTITWSLKAMPAPEWVVDTWPGSATIITVRTIGIRSGKPVDETCFYVTSLRTSAKALLRYVRDRWAIENSLHWVRDTQLREDSHRYKEANGVQILATLRTMGLNALRLDGKHSIAEDIAAVAQDIRALLVLLGWREAAPATQ